MTTAAGWAEFLLRNPIACEGCKRMFFASEPGARVDPPTHRNGEWGDVKCPTCAKVRVVAKTVRGRLVIA